jgi:DNA-binding transcriptional regulator YiaG
MTPHEFKEARITLGLSQAQLGEILNTNPTTIRKWEAESDRSTSRKPNPVAVQVLRWLLDGFRPPQWPVN